MKPCKFNIRKATESDFPRWIKMRKELWPEASFDELKDVEHLYKGSNFICFFAEQNSEPIGFIELTLRPYVNGCDHSPVAFVEGIWVDNKFQKQGIGRALIKKAEEWAQSSSIKELASDTRIESEHSIHAHKSWGFEETERVAYFKKNIATRQAKKSNLTIRNATTEDSELIKSTMEQFWGGEPLIVRSKNFFPSQLPGFLAFDGDMLAGFLFFTVDDTEIEIIVLEAFQKFHGLGTKLLERLKSLAQKKGIKRIFLMTNNDNLDALRFYQKRGFRICGIHLNSVEKARKLKPTIGYVGDYGIPLRDEIDLELFL